MKLEKLTEKQEALIPVVRQEWLDRAFKNRAFDPVASRTGIEWAYEKAKLARPAVLFVSSPLAAQMVANLMKAPKEVWDQVRAQVWDQVGDQVCAQVWAQVGDQVRAQVRAQVCAQVWDQVWDQVGDQVRAQVRAQVGDQVRAQVWDQVGDQVGDQVRAQVGDQVRAQVRAQVCAQVWAQVGDQVRAQKQKFFDFAWLGWDDYGWCAWGDYFTRIGILKNPEFDTYSDWVRSGQYDVIALDGLAIVCEPPTVVSRDERNRLSSTARPAIEWRDGFKLWFINGVHFPFETWEPVASGSISAKEILRIENMEQRMIALKLRGADKLLQELDAKLINRSARGNELFLLSDVFSVPAYFLRYKDPSTDRIYVSGVAPDVGIGGSADAAMAWKHNLNPKEYEGLRYEA